MLHRDYGRKCAVIKILIVGIKGIGASNAVELSNLINDYCNLKMPSISLAYARSTRIICNIFGTGLCIMRVCLQNSGDEGLRYGATFQCLYLVLNDVSDVLENRTRSNLWKCFVKDWEEACFLGIRSWHVLE
jgi:hypothetical protein